MARIKELLKSVSRNFDKLRPQVITPAEGYLAHDYLIPGGYYKQMWDWDGFFIGNHLASRSTEEARYLKFWVLNLINSIDDEGYVAGCIAVDGPRPLFGKFAMKPFLSQGAYLASKNLDDFSWIRPVYAGLRKVLDYREATQRDAKYGLFFWDNAMQSGADNNPAIGNEEKDRTQILSCDINTLQLRETISMRTIADSLGKTDDAKLFDKKATELEIAIKEHLWHENEKTFFNRRRDNSEVVRRITYSNFIPLIQKLAPADSGREMIRRYLWNEEHMLAPYGLRTLSKQDEDYNNECMIKPYSNWQGPVWPIANYLYHIGLKNYGFETEVTQQAETIGRLILGDIETCGSMHENYHADSGAHLAPTAEQSPGGVFTGFVGWNLLVENMLLGAVEGRWTLLGV